MFYDFEEDTFQRNIKEDWKEKEALFPTLLVTLSKENPICPICLLVKTVEIRSI